MKPIPVLHSPTHLDRVRQTPCCFPGCTRLPRSDPHHLPRHGTRRGNDFLTVPLCRPHHEQVQTDPELERRLLPHFYLEALRLALGDDLALWQRAVGAVERVLAGDDA